MTVPLAVYLPYLVLTLVIEAPLVVAALTRRSGWRRALGAGVLASVITHPLLWFVWSRVVSIHRHYVLYSLSGEAWVVLVEAAVFFALALPPREGEESRRRRLAQALVVSLLVNFASWAVGMVLHGLGLLSPLVRLMARALYALLGG